MSPLKPRPPGIELALLGFLREGPRHGYQIHHLLSDPAGMGSVWRLKQSQLYALLSKLEKQGYIWGEIETQAVTRPPRHIYHLTATGEAVYIEWLLSPVRAPRQIRQEFMAKLYFARLEGLKETTALLDGQRQMCQQWLQKLISKTEERNSYAGQLHEYRLGQIRATLVWLDTRPQEIK